MRVEFDLGARQQPRFWGGSGEFHLEGKEREVRCCSGVFGHGGFKQKVGGELEGGRERKKAHAWDEKKEGF